MLVGLDANYVWPACVTLFSLATAWEGQPPPLIHCVCAADIGPTHVTALKAALASCGGDLRGVRLGRDLPDTGTDYLYPMVNARLIAPGVLDVRSLAYLDCDTVVCASLDALFRPVAGGYAVATARDTDGPELHAPHVGPDRFDFGRRSGSFPYFNADAMLIDVDAWRAARIGEQAARLVGTPCGSRPWPTRTPSTAFSTADSSCSTPGGTSLPTMLLKRWNGAQHLPGNAYIPPEYQLDLEHEPWIAPPRTTLAAGAQTSPWPAPRCSGARPRRCGTDLSGQSSGCVRSNSKCARSRGTTTPASNDDHIDLSGRPGHAVRAHRRIGVPHMSTIAIVMLTYHDDEPAGIERALASLARGLRANGHRVVVLTASEGELGSDPDVIRLRSVTFPRPVDYTMIPRILHDCQTSLSDEVTAVLTREDVDLVCWGDAVSGLGYLAPAPPGVRTALLVHFPRADDAMARSLAHGPDAVVTVSQFMIDEARRAGLDSRRWHAVPNALPTALEPPSVSERERLRVFGPVRLVARADPQKGVGEFLRATPHDLGRRIEVVLARAGFELSSGLQDTVVTQCREIANARGDIDVLAPLAWDDVQEFLAGAALAVVPSIGPESFGNVASEALSVGTPVVCFAMGHLPVLVGDGGRVVSRPVEHPDLPVLTGPSVPVASVAYEMEALWTAVRELLVDADAYHCAAAAAPRRVEDLAPRNVAERFLKLLGPTEPVVRQ